MVLSPTRRRELSHEELLLLQFAGILVLGIGARTSARKAGAARSPTGRAS